MLTLSSESLKGYDLNRIFAFAKEAGYEGVDIAIDPKLYDTQNAAYLKELIKDFNLPIIALQTSLNSTHTDILDAVKTAKEIGTGIVIVQPPKIISFKQIQWLKHEIPKIRKKEEISIALENGSSKTYLGFIPERAMNSLIELRRFKHACIDTSRMAEKKQDLIRVYDLLKDYIVHIHLSNVYRHQSYSLPMKGMLPLESFLSKLKNNGYKGAISLKVLPKFLDAGNDRNVLKNLKECKEFYDSYFINK
ncbi:sugar phosphate isomerase/epimerase [Candidatus Peregrinibacteria bacterium]|nr:sugar phosphate isomerase/epimerase [Candidatus Peregrinibacteria bacterium]